MKFIISIVVLLLCCCHVLSHSGESVPCWPMAASNRLGSTDKVQPLHRELCLRSHRSSSVHETWRANQRISGVLIDIRVNIYKDVYNGVLLSHSMLYFWYQCELVVCSSYWSIIVGHMVISLFCHFAIYPKGYFQKNYWKKTDGEMANRKWLLKQKRSLHCLAANING